METRTWLFLPFGRTTGTKRCRVWTGCETALACAEKAKGSCLRRVECLPCCPRNIFSWACHHPCRTLAWRKLKGLQWHTNLPVSINGAGWTCCPALVKKYSTCSISFGAKHQWRSAPYPLGRSSYNFGEERSNRMGYLPKNSSRKKVAL